MRKALISMGMRECEDFILHSGLHSGVKWEIEPLLAQRRIYIYKAIMPFLERIDALRPLSSVHSLTAAAQG